MDNYTIFLLWSSTLERKLSELNSVIYKYVDDKTDGELSTMAEDLSTSYKRSQLELSILEFILNSIYTGVTEIDDIKPRKLKKDVEEVYRYFVEQYTESDPMSDEDIVDSIDEMVEEAGEGFRAILGPALDAKKPKATWFADMLVLSIYIGVTPTFGVKIYFTN